MDEEYLAPGPSRYSTIVVLLRGPPVGWCLCIFWTVNFARGSEKSGRPAYLGLSLSFKALLLIFASYLFEMPFVDIETPPLILVLRHIGIACTVPGIVCSIIGLFIKERKKSTPITGLILNSFILAIGLINILKNI